ncbi:MAG: RsmD family RNA methyltransferase [Actinobacteria bacterium]|nr:RsmD family RNA methyltransferase [Actinomycetota bacterium]
MRVVAGTLRGRRLVAPPGLETRPTADRAREGLFNMLGDVRGAIVLDCFAGSGALAIEACSRGAARAVFVERARPALDAIRQNVRRLGLADRTRVAAGDWCAVLEREASHGARFDLVFADPPYGDVAAVVTRLGELLAPVLAPEARVVLEYGSRDHPNPIDFGPGLDASHRERRFGSAAFRVTATRPRP